MSTISIRIDSARANAAFLVAHDVMLRHLNHGLQAAAGLVAAEAKIRAPKFHSHLTNAIRTMPVVAGVPPQTKAWRVTPAVHYAAAMEHGVPGPMPRMPGVGHGLMEWVKAKFAPENDRQLRSLAFVIRRGMQRHGIKAQPFMTPAMEASEAYVRQILADAVADGVAEAFGGR